ncbi:hypothetical protein COO60DRAFT_1534392 [Scenedesmus sp. NREL 46B-D3]|nr:hypothetical protein COO60DRAFT_1534392 [Scenedesmus sp. NREL 46B-D3]
MWRWLYMAGSYHKKSMSGHGSICGCCWRLAVQCHNVSGIACPGLLRVGTRNFQNRRASVWAMWLNGSQQIQHAILTGGPNYMSACIAIIIWCVNLPTESSCVARVWECVPKGMLNNLSVAEFGSVRLTMWHLTELTLVCLTVKVQLQHPCPLLQL